MLAAVTYDSAARRPPFVAEVLNFWERRGLLRLLVTRDLTVRYKRSVLGVTWTVLNPLLMTATLWIVFSQIFRFEVDPGIPFIVYLLSGVLIVNFFTQGALAAGGSIVNSAGILTKVYVPPECFALSAALASAINFGFNLLPLLAIQLILGVGIPWTIVFLPLLVLAMLAFITGVGLLIASAAVFFYDVIDLTQVLMNLLTYLTPSFYPISIVPEGLRLFVQLNPLYSYLTVFRHIVYRGDMPPVQYLLVVLATSVVSLMVGVGVFSRLWRKLVVML